MHGAGTALKQFDFLAGIERLAIAFDQFGLIVERVALAGRAGHEELDDSPGLRRMMQFSTVGRPDSASRANNPPSANSCDSAMPPRPPPRCHKNLAGSKGELFRSRVRISHIGVFVRCHHVLLRLRTIKISR